MKDIPAASTSHFMGESVGLTRRPILDKNLIGVLTPDPLLLSGKNSLPRYLLPGLFQIRKSQFPLTV